MRKMWLEKFEFLLRPLWALCALFNATDGNLSGAGRPVQIATEARPRRVEWER